MAAITTLLLCAGTTGSLAQKPDGLRGLGNAHDAALPIEITADALSVAQAEQTAIFSGKVVATQGELRLSADNLRVYYRGGNAPGAGSAAGGAISKLDATGNVAIVSATESAKGEWAVYDVDSGQITMGGNVVLNRDKNQLRGSQLVIDLQTGQSRILGDSTGRVKGVFVPNKKPSGKTGQ